MAEAEQIRPLLIVDQILGRIKKDIFSGVYKPGEALHESALQKRFGVSRSPIREALLELNRLGFVEIIPRKGAFVWKATVEDVKNMYEIRAVLEGLAAKKAYLNDPNIASKLVEVFHRMKDAFQAKNNELYLEEHDNFHSIWIQASKNPFLIKEALRLRELTSWHAVYYHFAEFDYSQTIKSHQQILDEFLKKQGNSEGVENSVRANIMTGGNRIIKMLEKGMAAQEKEERESIAV